MHTIVVGLGFGDEGKGATVDWLCSAGGRTGRGVSGVVRFNGGGQAAHNVIAGGLHHTFRQLGSGTLAGVPTHLSRHHRLDVEQLAAEAIQLERKGVRDPLAGVSVHPAALLVTPVHEAANRARERARGVERHGSTGLGIGETTFYAGATSLGLKAGEWFGDTQCPSDADGVAPRASDTVDRRRLTSRLDDLVRFYAPLTTDVPSVGEMVALLMEFGQTVPLADPLASWSERGEVVFEGAQGVLLDENAGFHPHTTWSTTLPSAARALLAEVTDDRAEVVGVTRTFHTRHGAGPFPSEDPALDVGEAHNGTGEFQGGFRLGGLDLGLLRYAVGVARPDHLAVTHTDVEVAAVDSGEVEPVVDPDDLAAREAASRRLAAAAPAPVEGPALAAIESLGVPALVTSDGPAREDRRPAG